MEIRKIISLPPNAVNCFGELTGLDGKEWFCTHDPEKNRLGSGGGTVWALRKCREVTGGQADAAGWLRGEKRIVLHAGGQSRRLPAYAAMGKILTPIPVARQGRGDRLSQNLLSLQIPLYEKLLRRAPERLHTLVACGDVYLRTEGTMWTVPDADVVCVGLWLSAEIARRHGVFVVPRSNPAHLCYMLQKPSTETLAGIEKDKYYLTDVGVWLLSDQAVKILAERSQRDGEIGPYDLYGTFGARLGSSPRVEDAEVNRLRVAVITLPKGEFFHFGSTRELIDSALALQNVARRKRADLLKIEKLQESQFVQNCVKDVSISDANRNLWIENSYVGKGWSIESNHVITGVPRNEWRIHLRQGDCVDFVPVGEREWTVRPYGFDDSFRGALGEKSTLYLGRPFTAWAEERGIEIDRIEGGSDLQEARIFPVTKSTAEAEALLRWMLDARSASPEVGKLWQESERVSANEIMKRANLARAAAQRKELYGRSLRELARNHRHSVFYGMDLRHAAGEWAGFGMSLPPSLGDDEPALKRAGDAMFRSEVERIQRIGDGGRAEVERAFSLLSEEMCSTLRSEPAEPRRAAQSDQIVWSRSPVRIDIAGGWTDTPPYCMMEGGKVVNLAIELNGQPPLQVFVKPSKEKSITLRSIDMGASVSISSYAELADFRRTADPFSIPKAALALAGFLPEWSSRSYCSLGEQLEDFGWGLELTTLAAIPSGSGLGTSSILATTVLGALSNFCGLGWDLNDVGKRALIVEQLLTTGGGWQDQFGGLTHGIKMLETESGLTQNPVTRWLPTDVYTLPEYRACHLLYYTGLRRTAKDILGEVVKLVFLNEHDTMVRLREMKGLAEEMFDAIQRSDLGRMGCLLRENWLQNQALDKNTNPEPIKRLTSLIDDLCYGYKLPGAGGGGYLYMIAKDGEAAGRIRHILKENRPNDNARFVDMALSKHGLQVSRS